MMGKRKWRGPAALTGATAMFCLGANTLGAQAAGSPAVGKAADGAAGPDPGVARVEQWACPDENLQAFREYVASVWAPIFDGMAREGLLSSWSGLVPSGSRDVEFGADGSATVTEVAEAWDWMGIWQGGRQEAFEASWREYHRRLAAAHPDGPGPEGLCTRVRVTTYLLGMGGMDR